MSFEIPTNFVVQYTTNVEMLLQQRGSKLRDAVTVGSYTGKSGTVVEQFGKVKATKNISRHGDTPLISTPSDRRWVYPTDYDWADLIDDQDRLRLLIEPTSPYAMAGAMALGRSIDDEILGAFYGTAKTGENGVTNTTLPGGQQVGQNTGGTASGLNIPKLRAAKKILMANEVDIDNDPLYIAISAEDHDDLLNETQAISLDYNTRPVLVEGKISSFMGFNFIHIEYTNSTSFDNASAMVGSGTRLVPCWARSGMHLGQWQDIRTQITPRPDKRYSTQVYCTGTWGATRTQEGKVVRIEVAA